MVYWWERRGRGVFLEATPIDVSTLLRERLFEQVETVILTSATLAVGGTFDFLKRRLGVQNAKERILELALRLRRARLCSIRRCICPTRASRISRARRRRKWCNC